MFASGARSVRMLGFAIADSNALTFQGFAATAANLWVSGSPGPSTGGRDCNVLLLTHWLCVIFLPVGVRANPFASQQDSREWVRKGSRSQGFARSGPSKLGCP